MQVMTEADRPPSRKDPESTRKGETLQRNRLGARWSSVGIQMVISVLIGLFGGQWLDRTFETDPWLTLAGVLLGATAAFVDMYRLAKTSVDDR